jgi:hypothetical protein
MIIASSSILDRAEREKALQAINQESVEDVAWIPLHYQQDIFAVVKGKNIKFTPRSDRWIVAKEIQSRKSFGPGRRSRCVEIPRVMPDPIRHDDHRGIPWPLTLSEDCFRGLSSCLQGRRLAGGFCCLSSFRYTGDPVLMLAGKYATQQEREHGAGVLRPGPPHVRSVHQFFIGGALKGNFGKSYISSGGCPGHDPGAVAGNLELAFTAICISFTLGVGLGVVVSVWPTGLTARAIMAGSLFGISIPTFLIGILLVMVFSVYWICCPLRPG